MDTDRRIRLDRYLTNRRTVLQGGLAAAAALAVPGVARRAFAAPSEPLRFIGWQYNPQIVAENVETFKKLDPIQHPAVLVASHGPFTWVTDAHDAVHNAVVLELIARLASETLRVNPRTKPMQPVLLDKHFLRKHGPGAYYGQK